MMNLQNLDYVLDTQDRFWIIHGVKKKVYANLVFSPDKMGSRYNGLTGKMYKKVILDNLEISVFKSLDIMQVFRPREFFKENYSTLPLSWKKIPDALMSLGIPSKDIGIFGSYLIGFNIVKDVDFVVYGRENCLKVAENIQKIRNLTGAKNISKEHIAYQAKKYSSFFSRKNSFKKILGHNWAGLQISKNVLSTIRFVYYPDEVLSDIEIKKSRLRVVRGKVIKDFETNFVPRIGYILSRRKKIRVLTYNWMFNSFLREGEDVMIRGDYNENNKTLYISDNRKHWVKILD